jgi:clan AA aspartic protease (TIGR02281 family)
MGLSDQLNFKAFALRLGLSVLALMPLSVGAQVKTGYKTPAYAAGVQAYRQGQYLPAIRYFRDAIQQDSGNTHAHYYLGLSLDHLGKSDEASQEYQYVVHQGRESNIVQFAHERLSALASVLPTPEKDMTQSIAMMQPMVPIKSGSTSDNWLSSVEQIAVPLKNNQNALMVDALLTQNQYTSSGAFIIDTGATYTSISQQMAEHLGMDLEHCEKVLITTANGRIEVPKITIDTLNVNGLEAHNVEATVIPVRHGSSFSGLLGLSFIRQFVVTIDPQAGHLIFRKN